MPLLYPALPCLLTAPIFMKEPIATAALLVMAFSNTLIRWFHAPQLAEERSRLDCSKHRIFNFICFKHSLNQFFNIYLIYDLV
jgi:hypothetical protein